MPRVPLLSLESSLEPVSGQPVGHASNLHRILGYNPQLLVAWKQFAATLREAPVSSRSLRELITLRIGQLGTSDYMWVEHIPMALAAGVTSRQIEALAGWTASDLFSDKEHAALRMTDAVARGQLGNEDFAVLEEHFPLEEIVELVFTAAFYGLVPRFTQAMDIRPETAA